mgnify:CR=1 FL=1
MTFFCRLRSLGGQKWFHKSVLHKNDHFCNVLCACSCNGSLHETPKNMRRAVNGPDKDKLLPSMKRELIAMKDKDVWEEVTTLPIGTIPIPAMSTYVVVTVKM